MHREREDGIFIDCLLKEEHFLQMIGKCKKSKENKGNGEMRNHPLLLLSPTTKPTIKMAYPSLY